MIPGPKKSWENTWLHLVKSKMFLPAIKLTIKGFWLTKSRFRLTRVIIYSECWELNSQKYILSNQFWVMWFWAQSAYSLVTRLLPFLAKRMLRTNWNNKSLDLVALRDMALVKGLSFSLKLRIYVNRAKTTLTIVQFLIKSWFLIPTDVQFRIE